MELNTLTRQELPLDWTEYQELSPLLYHEAQPALITAYAILWIIGLIGNVWVAFVVGYLLVKRRRRRSGDAPLTVQIYIFALCLCDMLVLAFLPLLLLDLIYGSWTIPSSVLCKLYLLSEGFNKFGAPWILTALSGFCCSNIRLMADLDSKNSSTKSSSTQSSSTFDTRHSQQEHRKLFQRSKTPSSCSLRKDDVKAAAVTVILCTLGVIAAMSPVLIYADVQYLVAQNETTIHILAMKCVFQPSEMILTTFTAYSFVAGYLCPAFLFTYYYSSILYYVRKHRRNFASNTSTLGKGNRSQQRYCRVTKTAIGLVGWTLAGWTPYWTIFLYFYFHPHVDDAEQMNHVSTIILSYFVHMLPYINCSGYPILYTLLNKNIRTAYARAKMASMNRRRRLRISTQGGTGGTTNSSSTRALRSSLDSDGEQFTQISERKQSNQNENTSVTLYQCDEYGSLDSNNVILRKISQNSMNVRKVSHNGYMVINLK